MQASLVIDIVLLMLTITIEAGLYYRLRKLMIDRSCAITMFAFLLVAIIRPLNHFIDVDNNLEIFDALENLSEVLIKAVLSYFIFEMQIVRALI